MSEHSSITFPLVLTDRAVSLASQVGRFFGLENADIIVAFADFAAMILEQDSTERESAAPVSGIARLATRLFPINSLTRQARCCSSQMLDLAARIERHRAEIKSFVSGNSNARSDASEQTSSRFPKVSRNPAELTQEFAEMGTEICRSAFRSFSNSDGHFHREIELELDEETARRFQRIFGDSNNKSIWLDQLKLCVESVARFLELAEFSDIEESKSVRELLAWRFLLIQRQCRELDCVIRRLSCQTERLDRASTVAIGRLMLRLQNFSPGERLGKERVSGRKTSQEVASDYTDLLEHLDL